MTIPHSISTTRHSGVPFHNHMDFCIGTGRLGLAMQKEYYDQLKLNQQEIGFSYIRGHGLLSDDIGIYQPYQDEHGQMQDAYNFTYLDRIMDMYYELRIKPFIELGFMPSKMASGEQTIFYWRGNVTPPADYDRWERLIQAVLIHLMQRYGEAEVLTWPVEVWNEPNLPGFWKDADFDAYCTLYAHSAKAVKAVHPGLRVGGPAICGGSDSPKWMCDFLQYCLDHNVPLDFVTRHAYMGNAPSYQGRYLYHTMRTIETLMREMRETRDAIDTFETYRGMEMHITEFNTSYHPFCPIHDTNANAALIAGLLSQLGDVARSYSYWTFGDVFEEQGIPATPFHGGFGLVANGGIPKPTFWTFAFFKQLQGALLCRSKEAVICQGEDGVTRGVVWNDCEQGYEVISLEFEIEVPDGEYALLERVVDQETCNPQKAWHDMGQPASLTGRQHKQLIDCARPLTRIAGRPAIEGKVRLRFDVAQYGMTYFELTPVTREADRGFDYQWYLDKRITEDV